MTVIRMYMGMKSQWFGCMFLAFWNHIPLYVVGQLVFLMFGMRKAWFSLEMHCLLESVAELISSKVCLCIFSV